MYYKIHHIRAGEELETITAWCPETHTGPAYIPSSVDRNFLSAADANMVAARAGLPTFDWGAFMIWFVPSNYSHLVDFVQVNMFGRMMVLGDGAKNNDLFLLDNGNGFKVHTTPNLQGNYTSVSFSIVMAGADIASSETPSYGLNVIAEATLNAMPLPFPSRNVANQTGREYYTFPPIVIINENNMRYGAFYGDATAPVAKTVPANYGYTVEEFFDGVEPVDMDDPYPDIEDSQPSGPAEGVGYPEDELVPIPSLPSVSVVDTGFVTLFNPSLSQVKALASYMWAGLFDVATFKKIFADPMDCILGFNMLPVAIPNGGTAEVVVGNISTGVSMTKAAGQWVELDCGSIDIDKPFGNYLDWSPYMKWSIYLPYIGTVDLSTDDIMGHTIHLVYHIDVLSCACVAYLEVDGRVMYQWTGSCGYSIPVTGENFRQMIANIVNIAANLGGAIATGGMTAPLAIASAASVTQNVMSSKPEVHRSGAIGSSAGMMGMQKPYLIQQGPRICKPEKQYHYLGYPAFVTVKLVDVSGYQEFSSVILDGIPCTEEERDMIATACAGGIYL